MEKPYLSMGQRKLMHGDDQNDGDGDDDDDDVNDDYYCDEC